jgi:hypothetical protein
MLGLDISDVIGIQGMTEDGSVAKNESLCMVLIYCYCYLQFNPNWAYRVFIRHDSQQEFGLYLIFDGPRNSPLDCPH